MDKKFSFTYVIFGASGDLAKRKLIPALYSLYVNQQVPDNFNVLGVSRTPYSDNQYREKMKEALIEFNEINDTRKIDAFIEKLFYQPLNYDNRQDYFDLKERLNQLQQEKEIPENVVFYLSTPPKLYGEVPVHLAKVGLNLEDNGWKRLIIEKPFGYDLESALKLKDILLKFGMKVPGTGFEVQNVNMDFHYSDLAHQRIPSAYERLIYDSIKGDSTLFARTEEVIEAWKFVMPVLDAWKNDSSIPVFGYPAGTWGPEHADDLIEEKAMTWRYPCKNLADDGVYCEL